MLLKMSPAFPSCLFFSCFFLDRWNLVSLQDDGQMPSGDSNSSTAETFPKPTLRITSGSATVRGGNLTLSCAAAAQYRDMRFILNGGRVYRPPQDPPGSEAVFHFTNVNSAHEGRYYCEYHSKGAPRIASDFSDTVEVTLQDLPRPSISYEPVRSHEGDYIITCSVPQDKTVKRMFLYKDGKQSPLTDRTPSPGNQSMTFPISGVNARAGTGYRCSYQIQESGEFVESPLSDPIQIGKDVPKPSMPKPSIFYETAHHVKGSYNINCSAPQDKTVKIFFLHTDGEQAALVDRTPSPGSQSVIFPISGVNAGDGTEYRCSYQIQDSGVSVESPLSDPIQIGEDLTQGSIVQIVLAGVVLLLLTVIVAEHCYSSKRDGKRTRNKHYQND